MKDILQIDFSRNKYVEEYLIDVGRIETLKGYVRDNTPHALSFYDITFIQSGTSEFCLDEETILLKPNTIVFTSPFQVRVWKSLNNLKGVAVFFVRDFVNTLFNDRYFLDRFAFFDNPHAVSHINVDSEYFNNMIKVLVEMEQEFQSHEMDSNEILASNLYKILTALNRKIRRDNVDVSGYINPHIQKFKQLVENKFKEEHKVSYYGQRLYISPAYLNELCRTHVGISASGIIKNRLSLEAKRLLLYSGLSIKQIAYSLNFSDSANFNRFFKNNVGCSPGSYHKHSTKRHFFPRN